MEKQIKQEEIYKGKILTLTLDDVECDNGKLAKREVVFHNGGAAIALKDHDGKYFMVKQYRYVHDEELLEFCAGKIEEKEKPETTVLREVQEELGYSAKNLKSFGYIIPTCGYSKEKIYLYYGEVDKKVKQNLDEDEAIKIYKYSYAEIKQMIQSGEISDGKTIALMYYLQLNGIEKE